MEVEKTLALIKPDAVLAGKSEEIKQLIELHGFTIVCEQKLQLTKVRAEEFYGEHHGKPFFTHLVDFTSSGPMWAMVLGKLDAAKSWRALMGPTNAVTAREQAPRSIRALYGTDGRRNACHGSDSSISAEREIKFFFPSLVLEPLLDSDAAQQYVVDRLQPALSKALTALARQKPTAEKFEAITFLADFLLNNNPNKPKIVLPEDWDPSADAAQQAQDDDDEELFSQAQARAAAARATQEQQEQVPMAAPAATAAGDDTSAAHSMQQAPLLEANGNVAPQQDMRSNAGPSAGDMPQHGMLGTAAAAVSVCAPLGAADEAATKVQAAFRGYQARKEVADMKRAGIPENSLHATTETAAHELKGGSNMSDCGPSMQSDPKSAGTGAIAASAPPVAPQAEACEYTPSTSSAGGSDSDAPAQPNAQLSGSEYTPAASEESGDVGGQGQSNEPVLPSYSPEQIAAVTRIQAVGRGMLDRKRVAGIKYEAQSNADGDAATHGEPEYTTDDDSS